MNGAFSRIDATANRVEGDTSSCDSSIDLRRLAAESLTPGRRAE